MRERKELTVLASLGALYAAAALLIVPADFSEPNSPAGYLKFAPFGVFLVPPVFLAFCAVFGSWPAAVRRR